jgi:hypothetical protein
MRFIFILFLIAQTVTAAPYGDIGGDIAAAIRGGKAQEVARWFSNNVDLTVLGKEEMYSKAQAEQVLRDFFVKYPPLSFDLSHKATNPAAAQYGIGTYKSTNRSKFRVYFLIKKIGNQQFIQQLSIENER